MAPQREALQSIAASTEQLRELLDGILAYVEWTQRLQHLQKQRTGFFELARDLRQRVNAELGGEKGFEVVHDDGDVDVDAGLFLDALLELVRNARKFGTEGTTVRVSMRRETDDSSTGGIGDTGGSCQVIEVSDDGPGIPPEHLERIFQRFYQVESDFTGQVHGLGLGLSRVQRAIRALGATLDVDSKLNQGTRFTIRFPAAVPRRHRSLPQREQREG
jgi:signal transduction histidine kinase